MRKIEKAMKRKGIKTQRELSALAGVHHVTTCRAFSGKKLRLSTIARLCLAVGLRVEDVRVK